MAMKAIFVFFATATCLFAADTRVVFKGETFLFSEKIGPVAEKKRIEFNTPGRTPFGSSLIYDSSLIKIFQIKGPASSRDSLEDADLGVLSQCLGVQDPKGNRYLNISDLKRLGKRTIEAETIQRWIIYGEMVKSNGKFQEFLGELRNTGIIPEDSKKDFTASAEEHAQGFRKISMTILINEDFIRFSYLVSSENEVMFLGKEILIHVHSPKLKSLPEMPSFITLENPGDSTAYTISRKYVAIIRKYDYELFN
jgi:hypothetical protein